MQGDIRSPGAIAVTIGVGEKEIHRKTGAFCWGNQFAFRERERALLDNVIFYTHVFLKIATPVHININIKSNSRKLFRPRSDTRYSPWFEFLSIEVFATVEADD